MNQESAAARRKSFRTNFAKLQTRPAHDPGNRRGLFKAGTQANFLMI
jgi:hypothetical protein